MTCASSLASRPQAFATHSDTTRPKYRIAPSHGSNSTAPTETRCSHAPSVKMVTWSPKPPTRMMRGG
eukprot:4432344-Heterocapsa_arctica.AAC.1